MRLPERRRPPRETVMRCLAGPSKPSPVLLSFPMTRQGQQLGSLVQVAAVDTRSIEHVINPKVPSTVDGGGGGQQRSRAGMRCARKAASVRNLSYTGALTCGFHCKVAVVSGRVMRSIDREAAMPRWPR